MKIPQWDYLSWARDRFGAVAALRNYPSALRGVVKQNGVYIRAGDQHHREVYDGVFVRREYDLEIQEPRLIVDAGAHIGLASVWFARRYPHAKIIAIEPDDTNFRMLVRNTRGLNVTCLQAGLWSRNCHLRIENPDGNNWAFRVVEDDNGPIRGLTVEWLIHEFGKIDCLKIDIEGSEVPVLRASRPWIHTLDTLIVELHDWLKPGSTACMDALKYAIDGLPFRHQQKGENIFLTRPSA